jgi:hypothetical protein
VKTLFLKLTAVSAGIVAGLSLVGIGLFWATHRPKQWDSNAVTAKLKRYVIYENTEKPEFHYFTNLYFDVTNNTSADYKLPVSAWSDHLMEQQSGSLLGSSGWELSLSQGTMPYNVPSGFFDPKPVFIPAHASVQILFVNDTAYTASHVTGKTKEQIVGEQFQHLDQLVVLDEAARYRINFPVKDFWKAQPER